jgi:hypothetical protein
VFLYNFNTLKLKVNFRINFLKNNYYSLSRDKRGEVVEKTLYSRTARPSVRVICGAGRICYDFPLYG